MNIYYYLDFINWRSVSNCFMVLNDEQNLLKIVEIADKITSNILIYCSDKRKSNNHRRDTFPSNKKN